MEYKQLDDYSKGFLDRILIRIPEYKQYVKFKKYSYERDGAYAYIDIPCPSDAESNLRISTYGDEITVRFDYFHCHFGYSDSHEEDYDEVIKMIKEIINEDIINITGTREGNLAFSCFIKPEEIASMEIDYDNYDAISIKSWKGSFNEIIKYSTD
ncbi:hypothetical protein [Desnuesiella massiliensis]|uniref:hypothetical protein n=1 Tax=Desnuesiella massiliensis TaxID=1650662 RepID=UPI0006E2D4A7|nr:hypothetical protein [Desnuesiella massiliensis]